MKSIVSGILSLVVAGVLAGCAGQTEQLSMQGPAGQPSQSVTFPNGTTFGGASGRQEYPRICSTDLDVLCCKISFPSRARGA
jgi:hypothetical protein